MTKLTFHGIGTAPALRGIGALTILLAMAFATTLAAEEQPSVEAAFVRCIVEKDPKLALAIRDAPSEKAFGESIRKAVELCPIDANQLSMGRFFDALNAALKKGSTD